MEVMSETQTGRSLRAGVFTLVCASLSAHGHALSGGHDVELPGLLLGMVVVYALAWAASAHRPGLLRLTGYMLWGQFALHLAFTVTSALGSGHASHSQALDTGSGSSAWTMITMHTASALLSAWWLHRGEQAFFAFLRFMALAILPLLVITGVLPKPDSRERIRIWFPEPWGQPRLLLLRHTQVLRGPPAPSVA